MLDELDALSVAHFHDARLLDPEWPNAAPAAGLDGAWRWIDANHRCNSLEWQEEDRARRTDPAEVAASKHLIDRYNQLRNDTVEAIESHDGNFALGVLWHPEEDPDDKVISALVERSRA